MPRKGYSPEKILNKLRQVEVAVAITNLARSGRIIVSTYVIAPALVALVLAGPLSLLEFLFDHFGDW